MFDRYVGAALRSQLRKVDVDDAMAMELKSLLDVSNHMTGHGCTCPVKHFFDHNSPTSSSISSKTQSEVRKTKMNIASSRIWNNFNDPSPKMIPPPRGVSTQRSRLGPMPIPGPCQATSAHSELYPQLPQLHHFSAPAHYLDLAAYSFQLLQAIQIQILDSRYGDRRADDGAGWAHPHSAARDAILR